MNLNEALDILESNNYICEFLEYSVSREKLKTLIEKDEISIAVITKIISDFFIIVILPIIYRSLLLNIIN